MMRAIRWLALGCAAIVLLGVGWLLNCERQNRADLPAATREQLLVSFDRAAAWMMRNRAAVLRENNPMLWVFVRNAAQLMQNPDLEALAAECQARSTNGTGAQFFFDSAGSERLRDTYIRLSPDWQPYQRLFAYGATCNAILRMDPGVQQMLSLSACEEGHAWITNPWCRTHQLMGLRFVQRNHCEADEETARTLAAVQAGILTELTWDFRVQDAYLQKTWMLIESGRASQVRPVWVRRVLEAQQSDGGWTGAAVLLPLPGGRVICWRGSLIPHLEPAPVSNFHATAQGLYLTALLLNRSPKPAR